MLYKPNYCCNCGEKIERVDWSLTTSRRFCDVCKDDFVVERLAPVVFVGLMAFVGIFGIGSYWRSGEKPPNIANKQTTAAPNPSRNPANQAAPVNAPANSRPIVDQAAANAPNVRPVANPKSAPPTLEPAPAAPDEPVYFCGAETKKGTPCSRRVKGGGRCWQHKGQNAMLPPEKLLASR